MDLGQRVERLEKQNRRLQWLLTAAIAAIPVAWTAQNVNAQGKSPAGPVEVTEKLVVRSAAGTPAAEIYATSDGSKFQLYDVNG
jgi:hypothetical protein